MNYAEMIFNMVKKAGMARTCYRCFSSRSLSSSPRAVPLERCVLQSRRRRSPDPHDRRAQNYYARLTFRE